MNKNTENVVEELETNSIPISEPTIVESLIETIEKLEIDLKWQIFKRLGADLNNTQIIKTKVKIISECESTTTIEDKINEFISENDINIINILPYNTNVIIIYY